LGRREEKKKPMGGINKKLGNPTHLLFACPNTHKKKEWLLGGGPKKKLHCENEHRTKTTATGGAQQGVWPRLIGFLCEKNTREKNTKKKKKGVRKQGKQKRGGGPPGEKKEKKKNKP